MGIHRGELEGPKLLKDYYFLMINLIQIRDESSGHDISQYCSVVGYIRGISRYILFIRILL